MNHSIKNLNGTESQRTPKKVARLLRCPGLGVRSVGPVIIAIELDVGFVSQLEGESGFVAIFVENNLMGGRPHV